jgi:hydroxymethylpyrimidine pyrophosphatase-like HAD family hydrolase
MHLMVLACDLDGTLAEQGEVSPATWAQLRAAKQGGFALLLATGRVLHTFAPTGPYAELCDAIVAEDGAVVYFPRRDLVVLPFGHLDPTLVERFEAQGVPLSRGMAIAATHVPHDEVILELLRELGGGASVEYNRGAVMVLPPGATKGSGLRYAVRELGYSLHNVVACGDAENDRSLFEVAELAVAVANAPPLVQDLADVILPEADGAGVRALIADLLSGHVPPHRRRPERQLLLGHSVDGTPITLDPFAIVDRNLGIVGASGSGKSWLAGLLAEELLKLGYQVCIIDPEGDHRGLRAFPHTLLLGAAHTPLPAVADVLTLIEHAAMSLVIDLSLAPPTERSAYLLELLRELWSLRAGYGRPHWLLLDEVQHFCRRNGDELTDILLKLMRGGGVGVVTYQPSQVPPTVLAALDHWLLTRFDCQSEQAVIAPFLSHSTTAPLPLPQIESLPRGQAYLALHDDGLSEPMPGGMVTMRSAPRAVPHVRHLHKYLRATLPRARRFYFCDAAGRWLGIVAGSLWAFRAALDEVPLESLQYHLERGDFERWLRDALHDAELARRLHKLADRQVRGTAMRQALITAVAERYDELDRLI